MIKNNSILIFKKEKDCIELKRVGRDRHPCLNSVRRRLTTAYRSASGNTGLVFDTFRFVTSIAEQSRAKSFGHAERRQAITLAAIARRADIVSASRYSKRMVADGLVSKEKKCLWLGCLY
jgi:hypothetical protein